MTFRWTEQQIEPDRETEQNSSHKQPLCARHAISIVVLRLLIEQEECHGACQLSDMTTVGFYEVARFFRTHDLVLIFQTSCGLPLQLENHRCSKSPPFEVQPAPIRGLTAR